MASSTEGVGVRHLTFLARAPRPAGSENEARAREYAAQVLRDAGFDTAIEEFGYSCFPGRYATPVGGAMLALVLAGAAWSGLIAQAPVGALATLSFGTLLLGAFAAAMMGDGVLTLPWLRERSVNLTATRGGAPARVWLVAHLDSKSQPVPSLLRIAGIVMLAAGLVIAFVAGSLQLMALPHRTLWWVVVVLTAAGAPPVLASVVGANSDGAVDNASGVATVLAAIQAVPPSLGIGVLLPSAEELGLAGVRAWTRERSAAIAINCDGVDDDGTLMIMHDRRRPATLIAALQRSATTSVRVRRMPLGMLADSVALADRGWATVTVSRGGWSTLRRIHTRHDSLANLRGTGIDAAATLIARTVEALA